MKQSLTEIINQVLDEMSTTSGVSGYATPYAFGDKGKEVATKSLPGYKVSKEIDEAKSGKVAAKTPEPAPTPAPVAKKQVQPKKQKAPPVAPETPAASTRDIAALDKTIQGAKRTGDVKKAGQYSMLKGLVSKELKKRGKLAGKINESRYYNFKNSDIMKNETKVSFALKEVKKILNEVGFVVSLSKRLKNEMNIPMENCWKSTPKDLKEISKKLLEIHRHISRLR